MKKYISTVLDGMAKGLFASLIVGTVIFEFGDMLNSEFLMNAGMYAKYLMGPAIGVGIARKLEMKQMTSAAAVIVGAFCAGTITPDGITIGDPLTALIGSVIILEMLNRTESGNTFDIFIIPAISIVVSAVMFILLSPITMVMNEISIFINSSVEMYPIIASLFLATIFALFISGPLSSAALAIILGLEGVAAFVAVASTSSQMAGFFVMSIKDNGVANSLLVLFGSSKLHLKNIALNRYVLIPPLVASITCGVIAGLTNIVSDTSAAGMGNCALIGPLLTLDMNSYSPESIIAVTLLCFVIPMVVTYGVYFVMEKYKLIKKGDLCL